MTLVYVTTEFEGYHCWPDAPAEVAFLRTLHRHMFKVHVEVKTSSDRQVEFFILKRKVQLFIATELLPSLKRKQSMSCEEMALCIMYGMMNVGYELSRVVVSEDGENGSIALPE